MQPTFSSTEKKLLIISVLGILGILALETLSWGSRGFFYDEAWVANAIKEPSLEKALFYEKVAQNTPAGIIILIRTLVALLGDQEWVYRLPALLGTLLCIPLLILISKKLSFSTQTLRYTLLLFTLHPLVLQYSQEAKQYPLDMFIMLGILYTYLTYVENPTPKNNIRLIASGIFSFFFSYITPFALGGIAASETLRAIKTKKINWPSFMQLSVITGAISIIYLIAYRPNHTSTLHHLWILNGGFPTFATWYEPFVFFITSFYRLAGSFSHPLLALPLLILIALGIYQCKKHTPYTEYLLGVCATLIGTVLIGAYPLSQSVMHIRVQLFLLPFVCLYVAQALTFLEQKILYKKLFISILSIGMLGITLYALSIPTYGRTNDMSYVFQEYQKNKQGEETLIASALRPEFEYYVGDPEKKPGVTILLSRTSPSYAAFIDTYIASHRNQSFWFIPSPASAEPRIALKKIEASCTLLSEYHHLKSALYYIRC